MAALSHVWSSRTIDSAELASLYEWLDTIPLSKQRNVVEKDFADGVLAAEIIKHYFPGLVDIRDYLPSPNVKERKALWSKLNDKVCNLIGLNIPSHVMTQMSITKTGVAQLFLNNLRTTISLHGSDMYPPINYYQDPSLTHYHRHGGAVGVPHLQHQYHHSHYHPHLGQDPYDYEWYKKQTLRALQHNISTQKKGEENGGGAKTTRNKANGSPVLPPLSQRQTMAKYQNNYGIAAAKLEIDNKSELLIEKDDELEFIRGQLKRLEVVVKSKNSRIQELITENEKLKGQSSSKTSSFQNKT